MSTKNIIPTGLVAENLGKTYSKRPILLGASFHLQRGEAVGLLGLADWVDQPPIPRNRKLNRQRKTQTRLHQVPIRRSVLRPSRQANKGYGSPVVDGLSRHDHRRTSSSNWRFGLKKRKRHESRLFEPIGQTVGAQVCKLASYPCIPHLLFVLEPSRI